ncbi:hypothetical protein [Sphingobacterium sp. SGG-5]|nr:hypothetical protein [Sphingobacterium sp. SGG-5]
MDMNKYKRDYKYKSAEGEESGKNLKWLIIITAIIIGIIAYIFR